MNLFDRNRWNALWRDAGVEHDLSSWYERLVEKYSEPRRQYHNLRHIADCLREFDSVKSLAREPIAVECAIWFHDAVYDPRATDNEEQSADLARLCIAKAGLASSFSESVTSLVLATKTHDPSLNTDTALMLDIDLSILGRAPDAFVDYEAQIRQEYAWVPEEIFASKRAQILQRFLDRERIYATDLFRDRYERQARRNLSDSIRSLNGKKEK